ncbi:threonylcarbamoyl-AMP synthase [Leptospira gomenensis]|uniref:Threonylcarbamoyl-AMP synthase n=1 Tax=Leptospira gomenensis TaxID=2484974 RepID=A0A5F1YC83_9LEPT|nr:L-threonylcarbamoyladenylate synthase [Leptospira gomenensis]TGK35097.1 threonylcarbamoyl-AMP synthase [Leptospira gomenensis]TGK35225.1 threonylcarbamoyl-AMP synthase [Leptospira gomenensis]TGK41086.1 threonylcarbamoyl-AMP synthase [Leptospira gomenensis]
MRENKVDTILTDSPREAAQILLSGGLVVFPTETVYGIGASAFDQTACKKIYEVKNRPSDNPLILHVKDLDSLLRCAEVPQNALRVFESFSPGPITGIFRKKDPRLFTAGLATVAVRIPSHPTASEFLKEANVPVAAPSANLSGKPSITKIEYILEEFWGKVDCILRGPDPTIGIESTVVSFVEDVPILLRPGFIDETDIRTRIDLLDILNVENPVETAVISPGLKYRHYAPLCKVVLVESLTNVPEDVAQIGFTFFETRPFQVLLGSNEEYMSSLYSFFVECDRRGIREAWCEIPKEGWGKQALLNRITKAAQS